jgi:hypothetical protein
MQNTHTNRRAVNQHFKRQMVHAQKQDEPVGRYPLHHLGGEQLLAELPLVVLARVVVRVHDTEHPASRMTPTQPTSAPRPPHSTAAG